MRGFVRGFVGSFVWWLKVFAHNWIAHPLVPLAEMADAFAGFVEWLHDSTAPAEAAPPTSEAAPAPVEAADPSTLHLRGRIRYREPRSVASAGDPPPPEWSVSAVRAGWVPPGPASTAEVAPPASGWDESWSGPSEATDPPSPVSEFPGSPADLRRWLEEGEDSTNRTLPIPNDANEAPAGGPIGGVSGWRR